MTNSTRKLSTSCRIRDQRLKLDSANMNLEFKKKLASRKLTRDGVEKVTFEKMF
jgi:hypothetical protein